MCIMIMLIKQNRCHVCPGLSKFIALNARCVCVSRKTVTPFMIYTTRSDMCCDRIETNVEAPIWHVQHRAVSTEESTAVKFAKCL